MMAADPDLLHPELRPLSKKMPHIPLYRGTLWLIRLLLNLQPGVKIPGDLQIENRTIQGQDRKHRIRLRVYRPKTIVAPAPVLVWMHGGGFVMGKPEMDDSFLFQFARELQILVVSVGYRTAPEHPFPASLEDCYAALKWVCTHSQALEIDPARMAIGGESAGGGLAATLVQLACDRQEVNPVFQMLVYPMLDDRTALRPGLANKEWLTWSQANNRFGWEAYLKQKCGSGELPPYAAASRREDLTGLPPAWIGVGTLDLFYEEDLAYAHRLKKSGVACELEVIPGAFHGFDFFGPQLKIVQDFRNSQIAALKKHLFPG